MPLSPIDLAINLVAGGQVTASRFLDVVEISDHIRAHPWALLLYCTKDATIFIEHPLGLRVKPEYLHTSGYTVTAITGLGLAHPILWGYLDDLAMSQNIDQPGTLTTLLKLRTLTNASRFPGSRFA